MGRPARYEVVRETPVLVIRDVGPWDEHMTVTNGAEGVVADLVARSLAKAYDRVLYFDSEGVLDVLVVSAGRFAGFRVASAEERAYAEGR